MVKQLTIGIGCILCNVVYCLAICTKTPAEVNAHHFAWLFFAICVGLISAVSICILIRPDLFDEKDY